MRDRLKHGDSVQYVEDSDGTWWFVIGLKTAHGPFDSKDEAYDVMLHLNVKPCSCGACVARGLLQ